MGLNYKQQLNKQTITQKMKQETQPIGEWSFQKSIAEKSDILKFIRW